MGGRESPLNAAVPRSPIALLAVALLVPVCPAHALTLLTEGKVAAFRSAPGRASSAVVHVERDRALRILPRPTCPAASSLRFALSRHATDFAPGVRDRAVIRS